MGRYDLIFKAIGGSLVCICLVILFVLCAFTYQREDTLRAKIGFPSLYEQSHKGISPPTVKDLTLLDDFVDSPETRNATFTQSPVVRLESRDSGKYSDDPLQGSFSSTATWLDRHSFHFQRSSTQHKRQNSDGINSMAFSRIRSLREEKDGKSCFVSDNVASAGSKSSDVLISHNNSNISSSSGYQSQASSSDHHLQHSFPVLGYSPKKSSKSLSCIVSEEDDSSVNRESIV